jgi:hypothetical protein
MFASLLNVDEEFWWGFGCGITNVNKPAMGKEQPALGPSLGSVTSKLLDYGK